MSEKRRRLNTLSVADKVDLIREVERGDRKKQDIAKEFGIPASTLSTILKNKVSVLKNFNANYGDRKKMKGPEFPDVEVALFKWFAQCRRHNVPTNGPMLKEKAETIAAKLGCKRFKASYGWLAKWKVRNDVNFRHAHYQLPACSADWLEKLNRIVREYSPNDIFNVNETGLFFDCLPDQVHVFDGQSCAGGEHSDRRITVVLAANVSGTEKLKLMVVGKPAKPPADDQPLPVMYESNGKSWMTAEIFNKWLRAIDEQMVAAKRNILIFVDNFPAHSVKIPLLAVKIEFLPPDTLSKQQPLDRAIITNFKIFYRHEIVRKIVSRIEDDRNEPFVDLQQAIEMCDRAWRSVRPGTILNCFRETELSNAHVIAEPVDWCRVKDYLKIDKNDTFDAFVNVDFDVVVSGTLSIDEIIDEVKCNADNSVGDSRKKKEIESNPVTQKHALTAIKTLKKFVETKAGTSPEELNAIKVLENFIRAPC